MCWPTPARTPSPSPPQRLRGQRRVGRGAWRRPRPAAPAEEARWSIRRTPRPSPTWSSSSASPSSARSRPWWWPRPTPRRARSGLIALLVRGDHELNAVKAEKLPPGRRPLRMASEDEIRAAIGAGPGSLGPEGPADPLPGRSRRRRGRRLQRRRQQDGKHWFGSTGAATCRAARGRGPAQRRRGRPEPGRPRPLTIARGIEVGHIFQLGASTARR
jgi:hypothetical protein